MNETKQFTDKNRDKSAHYINNNNNSNSVTTIVSYTNSK